MRASRGAKVRSLSITILVAAVQAVLLTSISAGLVFIQPEERGVVISAVAPKRLPRDCLAARLKLDRPLHGAGRNLPDLTPDLHDVDCALRRAGSG